VVRYAYSLVLLGRFSGPARSLVHPCSPPSGHVTCAWQLLTLPHQPSSRPPAAPVGTAYAILGTAHASHATTGSCGTGVASLSPDAPQGRPFGLPRLRWLHDLFSSARLGLPWPVSLLGTTRLLVRFVAPAFRILDTPRVPRAPFSELYSTNLSRGSSPGPFAVFGCPPLLLCNLVPPLLDSAHGVWPSLLVPLFVLPRGYPGPLPRDAGPSLGPRVAPPLRLTPPWDSRRATGVKLKGRFPFPPASRPSDPRSQTGRWRQPPHSSATDPAFRGLPCPVPSPEPSAAASLARGVPLWHSGPSSGRGSYGIHRLFFPRSAPPARLAHPVFRPSPALRASRLGSGPFLSLRAPRLPGSRGVIRYVR